MNFKGWGIGLIILIGEGGGTEEKNLQRLPLCYDDDVDEGVNDDDKNNKRRLLLG